MESHHTIEYIIILVIVMIIYQVIRDQPQLPLYLLLVYMYQDNLVTCSHPKNIILSCDSDAKESYSMWM